jgi:hypothetical protein
MALKLNGAKLFPDKKQLIKLGKAYNIDRAEIIIEENADTTRDYMNRTTDPYHVKTYTLLYPIFTYLA